MKKKEIQQINVVEFDERFYQIGPEIFYPSVTYILQCAYPTSYQFIEWIGDVGNKRASQIKEEAGEEGSWIHDALARLIKGESIKAEEIHEKFKNSRRILKVKKCLLAFLDWYKEYKPEIILSEFIVSSDEGYAGTADLKCKINGEEYIVDFKTSKSIYDEFKLQVSAYAKAEGIKNAAILQLGNTTKKGYTFTEIKEEDLNGYYIQFNQVNNLFKMMNPNARPRNDVFPLEFSL